MTLPYSYHLRCIIIVESSLTTYNIDYLAVAIVGMQTSRRARTKSRIHYFYIIIRKTSRIQRPLTALEIHRTTFFNVIKVNYHTATINKILMQSYKNVCSQHNG